jgi:hypothetical protein
MSETGFLEECCWTLERQDCKGKGCRCRCHRPLTTHRLESYCAPGGKCSMIHPCHHPGCTIPPDRHPT